MADEPILIRDEDEGIVRLTLNRPERLNALNAALIAEIRDAFEDIPEDSVAVVIRGNGRAFSSGHDLVDGAEADSPNRTDDELREEVEAIQDITRAIRKCACPVVGAVHGWALGAGCELALSCDLVLVADDARFGFPETGVALLVTNGVNGMLARAIGPVRAKQLILLGEYIPAQRAYELGLIGEVVPRDLLDAALERWLGILRGRGRLATRLTKKLIDQGFAPDIEDLLAAESDAAVIASRSLEAHEAAETFTKSRG
jgi:enoyl-CoA hydratase/carnithine racemase